MSADPMGFFNDNYDEAESNPGFAGQTVPRQWALAECVDAETTVGKDSGAHGIVLTLQLDETHALSPKKRIPYQRQYASLKSKARKGGGPPVYAGYNMFRAVPQAFGLGDPPYPPTAENTAQACKLMESMLPGKKCIVAVGWETTESRGDQPRIMGWHRPTEENLKAIAEAGYDYFGVQVKERKEGEKTRRYLVCTKKAEEQTVATGSGPIE